MADLPRCESSSKVCFTKRQAQSKKNWLDKKSGRLTRLYQCEDCNWWHLSTIRKWKTIKKKKIHKLHKQRNRRKNERHVES